MGESHEEDRQRLAGTGIIIIIIMSLVLAGATGSAGKASQKAVDDNVNQEGGHGPYFQPPGNHYGHFSTYDKWAMKLPDDIPEGFADYEPYEYTPLGRMEAAQEMVEVNGVDVNAEEVIIIVYDDEGNLISYTTECDGVVTTTSLTRDDDGSVTDIAIHETSGKGSSTFIDWYLFSDIRYDDLGLVSGFVYFGTGITEIETSTTTGIIYDGQGQMIGYTETKWASDAEDKGKTVTTLQNQVWNKLGDVISYEEDITTFDHSGRMTNMVTVMTTYEYDMYGREIGTRETICSEDSPELVTSRNKTYDECCRTERLEQLSLNRSTGYAHYLHYNGLGQLVQESIIDHETGVMTDVEALKQELAGLLGEGMSPEELEEFFSDFSSGEIVEYIEVVKNGEDEGHRNESAYLRKVNVKFDNIYENPEYSHIAQWLEEYLDDEDDDDDDHNIQNG